MDISGLTTFFTAILDAAVKIAALVAAVAVAAAGFMYFGVVGHNQRAMDAAQNGVRPAFLGLASYRPPGLVQMTHLERTPTSRLSNLALPARSPRVLSNSLAKPRSVKPVGER
jgi:hypothetical protein